MEHCRVNAFNLVPFQLISLALHVLYDCINSSLCRWTEDSLPFRCSKGSKAVGALSPGWKIRREASSFFSDKHSKLSYWALHMLRKNMKEKCSTAEEASVTLIQGGHRLPGAPQPRQWSKKLAPGACIRQAFEGTACELKGAIKQATTGEAHTIRLSATSLFYRLQQRLYNSLATQDGYGKRPEKIVPWKQAQFLEVMHRKWKAHICVNMFQLSTYTLAFWSLPVMLFRQLL